MKFRLSSNTLCVLGKYNIIVTLYIILLGTEITDVCLMPDLILLLNLKKYVLWEEKS